MASYVDAELAVLAERGEFWGDADDQALVSLIKRLSRETAGQLDAVKRSMSDLRDDCEQLQASCVALTAEVHHLCQQHHVQAATDDPPTPPAYSNSVVLHVPPQDPLVVALQAAAAWQRSAPTPLPLPWVFGSAEYLQDPDCGLGSLAGSGQGPYSPELVEKTASPAPPTPREAPSTAHRAPLDTLTSFRAMLEQALQEGVDGAEEGLLGAGGGLFDDDEENQTTP